MHTHTLTVDLSQATQGENTYTCTSCSQSIVLVWNGYYEQSVFKPTNYGLRHEDEHENQVQVSVKYV